MHNEDSIYITKTSNHLMLWITTFGMTGVVIGNQQDGGFYNAGNILVSDTDIITLW